MAREISPTPRSRAELERWFNALIATHGASLGRLAATYARASGERDDLLQEIMFAIWRALPSFRHECSERTFLFRIAHNRALTHLAQHRALTVSTDEEIIIRDGRPNPEDALSSQQRNKRLLDAVRQLPVAYAQVVTLALEGLSYVDIADVLGISESNVGARLTRARQMLRKLMGVADGR